MGRSYRRSSSSSSSASIKSDRSVESITYNVSRKKISGVLLYLAGGDPTGHKHIRKDVKTVEYADGSYATEEHFMLVRDPYGATYYFTYDNDIRSQYRSESRSSRRSSKSSRSSQAGSRAPTAMGGGAFPMPQPMPMPMPQGQPFVGGGPPDGMPMGMGMGPPPMMPQGYAGGGIEIVDGMDPDAYSEYSGSSSGSYLSDEEDYDEPPHQYMPPMNNMHMPPPMMHNHPPPPMHGDGGGLGPGGPGFVQLS